MASKMNEKFLKNWDVIHGIMVVATILDPWYKMKIIEYYFPKIYGDNSFYQIVRIRNICSNLVREYKNKNSTTNEKLLL